MDGPCASFPRSIGWTYPSNYLQVLCFECEMLWLKQLIWKLCFKKFYLGFSKSSYSVAL